MSLTGITEKEITLPHGNFVLTDDQVPESLRHLIQNTQ